MTNTVTTPPAAKKIHGISINITVNDIKKNWNYKNPPKHLRVMPGYMRKKAVKSLLDKIPNIYGQTGWIYTGGGKFGNYRRENDFIIPANCAKAWDKLIEREEALLKKEAKEFKKTEEYKKNLEAKRETKKRIEEKDKENKKLAESCGLPSDKYGILLVEGLEDIQKADSDWLDNAYAALSYSMENNGVMAQYMRCDDPEEIMGINDFHHALCKAIGAYKRHNYTDYDEIDKRGMDEEQINDLRREMAMQ